MKRFEEGPEVRFVGMDGDLAVYQTGRAGADNSVPIPPLVCCFWCDCPLDPTEEANDFEQPTCIDCLTKIRTTEE